MSARHVRPIDPASAGEIALVAARMKLTLIEVLGEAQGASMYSDDWLEDRVREHLDPGRLNGQVFVSIAADGSLTGHTIVRVERDDAGHEYGVFSTTYVEPGSRRAGVADALVLRGEEWMRERGVTAAQTWTSETNDPLLALFRKHGYTVTLRVPEKRMKVLSKSLAT